MIAIIGNGNVATHLLEALKKHTEVCMVNPRTLEGMPQNPEMILISVSDDAIGEVTSKIEDTRAIIAHTSGSVPMSVLGKSGDKEPSEMDRIGVLYPLQTFTKEVVLDYSEIPVFIEGSAPEVADALKKVATMFSNDVREANSEDRKKLHLASVFVCNFTNALAGIGEEILKESGMDFSVLQPLLKQTVNKLQNLSPVEAQTGPAVRNDERVIDAHLKMLQGNPLMHQIYSLLTARIKEQAEIKKKLKV